MELEALKTRIEIQKGYQLGREDDAAELWVDAYCEALDWVLHVAEELICAEERREKEGELPPEKQYTLDHIACESCED